MTPRLLRRRTWQRSGAFVASISVLFSMPAYGHGLGLRYDLPLPLVLWIIGAASTVLLSFLIVAIAVRSNASVKAPTQSNLLRWQISNAVTGGKTRLIARLLAVAALILVATAADPGNLGQLAFTLSIAWTAVASIALVRREPRSAVTPAVA